MEKHPFQMPAAMENPPKSILSWFSLSIKLNLEVNHHLITIFPHFWWFHREHLFIFGGCPISHRKNTSFPRLLAGSYWLKPEQRAGGGEICRCSPGKIDKNGDFNQEKWWCQGDFMVIWKFWRDDVRRKMKNAKLLCSARCTWKFLQDSWVQSFPVWWPASPAPISISTRKPTLSTTWPLVLVTCK